MSGWREEVGLSSLKAGSAVCRGGREGRVGRDVRDESIRLRVALDDS